MKNVLKIFLILLISFLLIGCDWFDSDDDINSSSGSSSSTVKPLPIPTRPDIFNESMSNNPISSNKTENGNYWGRYNGNRPLWYFSKSMRSYPKTFYLTVSGCVSNLKVSNNGVRWEGNGYLVKESDVSGRGMAIHAPASCGSTSAYIKY